jgi:hypothetical protein
MVDALASLYHELCQADMRALYLNWLASALVLDPEESGDPMEPPCPAGLSALSPALKSLTRFFDLDQDVISAAAEGDVGQIPDRFEQLEVWLKALPDKRRVAALATALRGDTTQLDALRLEYLAAHPLTVSPSREPRRLSQLVERASELREAREAPEREQAAAARKVHLQLIEPQKGKMWAACDEIAQKNLRSGYDQVARDIWDLYDAARMHDTLKDWSARYKKFVSSCQTKRKLLEILDNKDPR